LDALGRADFEGLRKLFRTPGQLESLRQAAARCPDESDFINEVKANGDTVAAFISVCDRESPKYFAGTKMASVQFLRHQRGECVAERAAYMAIETQIEETPSYVYLERPIKTEAGWKITNGVSCGGRNASAPPRRLVTSSRRREKRSRTRADRLRLMRGGAKLSASLS